MHNTEDDEIGFKQKRDEFASNNRREFRESKFEKKRNLIQEAPIVTVEEKQTSKSHLLIVDERFYKEIETYLKFAYTISDFPQLLQCVYDSDVLKQHQGIIGIRKILSKADHPPIQAVVDAGLIPKMISSIKQ